jgi:hypothetical protein
MHMHTHTLHCTHARAHTHTHTHTHKSKQQFTIRIYLGLTCKQFLRVNSSTDMFLDHFLNNMTFFLFPYPTCQYQVTFICNMLIPVIECSFLLTSQPISLTPSEQITKSYETLFTSKCCTTSATQLLNI